MHNESRDLCGNFSGSFSIILTHKPPLHVAVNKEALPEGATAWWVWPSLTSRKPFDCVDHGILLNKLRYQFGIRGSLLNWLTSYLTSGSHGIKWNKI